MRAPFQILAIPYKLVNDVPLFCVFRRSDSGEWQFIAGGGQDNESTKDAAIREIFEEGGILVDNIISLKSTCFIPVEVFPKRHLYAWDKDTFVIPEYSFAFECKGDLTLSREHTELLWLEYDKAKKLLRWDSNKTALYELNCILLNK